MLGLALIAGWLRAQRLIGRAEVVLRPLRPSEWPLLLAPEHEALARVANVEQHWRFFIPAVVLALEKVVEKPLLELKAIVGIEVCPMLETMDFEPFLLGGRPDEPLDVAPQMQPCATPASTREKRYFHLRPVGRSFTVP